MSKKITLRHATSMILEALNIPESVDNYGKYYRPLLEEVNKGTIPSEKRGRKNLVDESDIQDYIDQLKEQVNPLQAELANLFKEPDNKDKVIGGIKGLLMLYGNKIYSSEKTLKEIEKLVEGL